MLVKETCQKIIKEISDSKNKENFEFVGIQDFLSSIEDTKLSYEEDFLLLTLIYEKTGNGSSSHYEEILFGIWNSLFNLELQNSKKIFEKINFKGGISILLCDLKVLHIPEQEKARTLEKILNFIVTKKLDRIDFDDLNAFNAFYTSFSDLTHYIPPEPSSDQKDVGIQRVNASIFKRGNYCLNHHRRNAMSGDQNSKSDQNFKPNGP